VVRDIARSRERAVPTDSELTTRVAGGDVAAFDELYRRHADAAWRVAQAIAANAEDAADAVAEAFINVFQALPAGRLTHGVPFRPYLLKATRNAAIDTLRRGQRVRPTDELGHLDGTALTAGPSEHVVIGEEVALVAGAFRDLPERWRSVLWLTEVEGMPARDAATVLGMSPNAVAQLSARARAGLRRGYLQAHVRNGVSPQCRATVDHLGAYVAGALPRREIAKVERHLDGCEPCRDRLDELEDVSSTLRRSVLPLPIGVGTLAAGKWHTSLAAAGSRTVRGSGRLVSSAARRSLAGATAVVLGLGVAGVLTGPRADAPPRVPTSRTPAAAGPAIRTLPVASDATGPDATAAAAAVAGASTASRTAAGTGPAPGGQHPSGPSSPPAGVRPTPPRPDPTSTREKPILQVNAEALVGPLAVGAAAGLGPGACTNVVIEPTTGGCTERPRSNPGVSVNVFGSVLG
jgi:RNA polymerase sigma factor (sigma-70 family)